VHERELPIEVIHAIEGYFDRGQDFQGIDAEQFARWHWWWTFFLYTGARASSACTATVDDIYRDRRSHQQLALTVKGAGVRRKNVPCIPALERVYQAVQPNDGLAADRPEHPFDPPGSDRPTADGRGSAASVVTGAIAPGREQPPVLRVAGLLRPIDKVSFPLGNMMREEPLLTAHRIGGCLVKGTTGDDHLQTFFQGPVLRSCFAGHDTGA
jgi:hypothetical protein